MISSYNAIWGVRSQSFVCLDEAKQTRFRRFWGHYCEHGAALLLMGAKHSLYLIPQQVSSPSCPYCPLVLVGIFALTTENLWVGNVCSGRSEAGMCCQGSPIGGEPGERCHPYERFLAAVAKRPRKVSGTSKNNTRTALCSHR